MSCHGVMRLVSSNGYIYYVHGLEVRFTRRFGILGLPRCREVGLPNVYELSRCREVGFIQRLYIISTAVRSDLPDGLGWVHEMVHCWFLCK